MFSAFAGWLCRIYSPESLEKEAEPILFVFVEML